MRLAPIAVSLYVTMATALLSAGPSPAHPALKAAFLFNFARFTTWPVDAIAPGQPLMLCVADPDVRSALEILAEGRDVDGRPVRVVRTFAETPAAACNLLYVGHLDDTGTVRLLAWLGTGSVLTVGDGGFAGRGGMIEFFVGDGQLRFAINRPAAQRARLRFSAKLLGLARARPR